MSLFNNAIIGASGQGGYRISRSVRLRSSASAFFNRTLTTPTNNKIFTISAWVKRGLLSTSANNQILAGYVPATSFDSFFIGGSASTYTDKLVYFDNTAGYLVSTQVFRDPSAWYHIMAAVDTTQATASNRVKLYVNGTQITSFSTANYPSLNQAVIFNSAVAHTLGSFGYNSTAYFDGYMTEFNFIDGQQLTPSSFGSTNTVTGVWQPIKYTGTYGTNGFYLNFSDNSNNTATTIGKDYSGNGNNWTPNNISVTSGITYDSMVDSPTVSATSSNYAVWNPLDKASVTVSEANMAAVPAADPQAIRATIGLPSSGKWYWEVTVSALGYGVGLGVADNASNLTTGSASSATRTYQFGSWFNTYNSGVVQYGTNQALTVATNWTGASQPTANDIIMIAVDMDNGSMWVGKNGTWFNSSGTANPATNTDPRWTGLGGTTWFPYMSGYSTTPVTCRINFGQRPFTYTPPTGFVALNTQNLPDATIKAGNKYFDATLYTGDGTDPRPISNSGSMQPDLVWIKARGSSTLSDHVLDDSVRGATNDLFSNLTAAEGANNSVRSFNAGGFSVGNSTRVNQSTIAYVGWQWNAGGSTVTNTSGSISSQVRANATAGFSVVTYTGTGANATVGHGLGVAPNFIIIKSRSAIANWMVGGSNIASAGGGTWASIMEGLNTTNAINTGGTAVFNSTAPTSSVFSLGTEPNTNGSGRTFVAYCFAAVAGYSAFGKYTGNGSADGPFVFTGFRPRFVLTKITSTTGSWYIWDTSRNTFNAVNSGLFPDLSNAEIISAGSAGYDLDILSNGFKLRNTGGNNTNGATYIFAAFAENPLKYALAR